MVFETDVPISNELFEKFQTSGNQWDNAWNTENGALVWADEWREFDEDFIRMTEQNLSLAEKRIESAKISTEEERIRFLERISKDSGVPLK